MESCGLYASRGTAGIHSRSFFLRSGGWESYEQSEQFTITLL
jgi:hypothetical protein